MESLCVTLLFRLLLGCPSSPSPTTGSHRLHKREERALLEEAVRGLLDRSRAVAAVDPDVGQPAR